MRQILYIKNMVCQRCIIAVNDALNTHGLEIEKLELGKVILNKEISALEKESLDIDLRKLGFEVLDDQKSRKIEKVKVLVLDMIYGRREWETDKNLSEIISMDIGLDYSYISRLFSEIEGLSIEKYVILQKIERIKELLVYNELNLSEIAYDLNYGSVQHLSAQFKRHTGLSPSHFAKMGDRQRQPIDKLGRNSINFS